MYIKILLLKKSLKILILGSYRTQILGQEINETFTHIDAAIYYLLYTKG